MHVVSLLFVFFSLFVSAQEERMKNQPLDQQKTPTTLSEAHAELERILPHEELAKIDAMPSEDGMIKYHFGLGASIRGNWGLWRGSPLAEHMEELGFTHPDDMSDVILATFWCKRHGQDFRLGERAAEYKRYWKGAQKAQDEEENRVEKTKAAIRSMMIGLRFEKRDVPTVQTAIRNGLNVRFLCPFRGGVFLTAYSQGRISSNLYAVRGGLYFDSKEGKVRTDPQYDDGVARGFYRDPTNGELHKMKLGEDFYTLGFYLDLKDHKIHRICVAEVNEVYAAVVAGDRAWFAGLTDGKAVLVGVGERDRIRVPLPQEDEIPDLGMDGQSLVAVYSKTIYRLTDRNWTLVHSGDILLPRSGLPPQLHGNMVFFRDEGRGESRKRLWWLTLGDQLHLTLLTRDTGLFEPIVRSNPQWMETRLIGPPDWEGTSSYCVTSSGDLWACVANGSFLLRRSKDGSYSLAIAYNSVQSTEDLPGKREADEDLSVSAVTALPDDTLLLAGKTGLYRLKGSELVQELAFTSEEAKDSSGKVVRHAGLDPSNILLLDDRSYVIGSSSWGGVYLLRKDNDGQWSCLSLNEKLGDPVIW